MTQLTLPYTDDLLARLKEALSSSFLGKPWDDEDVCWMLNALGRHRMAVIDTDRRACWIDERVYESALDRAHHAEARARAERSCPDHLVVRAITWRELHP